MDFYYVNRSPFVLSLPTHLIIVSTRLSAYIYLYLWLLLVLASFKRSIIKRSQDKYIICEYFTKGKSFCKHSRNDNTY